MLLTVFGGSDQSRATAKSGSRDTGSRVSLRMSTLDALDARVYAQQAQQLKNEQEVSDLVNAVYNAGMDLVRAQATARLQITDVLRPPSLADASLASERLDSLISDAQHRLQSTTLNRNSTTVATTEQRQWGFQLYTSFLRALHAAWTCAASVAESRMTEKHLIENVWFAETDKSSYGMFTLSAQRDLAALVRDVEQAVNTCIQDVDGLRSKHVQKQKAVQLPMDLHIHLCKSFLAQVREWKERVLTRPSSSTPSLCCGDA